MAHRHLAAVWMADIVGYSAVAARNEDRALRLVSRFQREVRDVVALHEGRIVKFIGDAALAEFPNTEDAALAASQLCRRCSDEFELRVGLHVGDVLRTGDADILGDGVNLAARLQAAADAGQILVSEPAWRQLRHREGFELASAGERELKGQTGSSATWALVAVPPGELPAPQPGKARSFFGRRRRRVYEGTPPRGRRLAPFAAAAAGIAALTLGLWASGVLDVDEPTGAAASPDVSRLAVLYFDDHSAGQQLGYLADGLTEALIHELSQVEQLDVVSRNGVKPFRSGSVPLDSIVELLQVGSIVEGSVTRSGERLRVTVQLIDGASGTHLTSRVIEEDQGELFALQDHVVREVADVLRRSLGREIRMRALRHGTGSEAAYELVLRAKALREEYREVRLSERSAGERLLSRADSLLAEASALDPRWTEPIVERGKLTRLLALEAAAVPGELDGALGERAITYADQALRIDSSSAAAFELRGMVLYELAQSAGPSRTELLAQAEEDLLRAVRLDPTRAVAWAALAGLQVEEGRFAEAKVSAERAYAADAFLEETPRVLWVIYDTSVQLGPTADAKAACDEGRRRFPGEDEFISCQLFMLASFPGVAPDLERGRRLADSLSWVVPRASAEVFRGLGTMLLAEVAARAGKTDSALAFIHAARGDTVQPLLAYNEAHARLLLGDSARAIELLSIFLEAHPDTAMLARDWWFEGLWGDPRFRRVVGIAE